MGIIGLGRIGQRVARRLQGWDCKLIYHDVAKFPPGLEESLHLTRVGFDDLLRTADIITLHVPLTRQTRGMISDREFNLMKPTTVLINACRGPVVDEAASSGRCKPENYGGGLMSWRKSPRRRIIPCSTWTMSS